MIQDLEQLAVMFLRSEEFEARLVLVGELADADTGGAAELRQGGVAVRTCSGVELELLRYLQVPRSPADAVREAGRLGLPASFPLKLAESGIVWVWGFHRGYDIQTAMSLRLIRRGEDGGVHPSKPEIHIINVSERSACWVGAEIFEVWAASDGRTIEQACMAVADRSAVPLDHLLNTVTGFGIEHLVATRAALLDTVPQ